MNRRYFLRGIVGAVAAGLAAKTGIKPQGLAEANNPFVPYVSGDAGPETRAWSQMYGKPPEWTQAKQDAYVAQLEETSKQIKAWMDSFSAEEWSASMSHAGRIAQSIKEIFAL